MSSNFCIVLPSNTKYEGNKTNKYKVHLPKHLKFDSQWVCGVHSVIYPHSWPTVGATEDQYLNIFLKNGQKIKTLIPTGSPTSPEELESFLNNGIIAETKNTLSLRRLNRRKRAHDGKRVKRDHDVAEVEEDDEETKTQKEKIENLKLKLAKLSEEEDEDMESQNEKIRQKNDKETGSDRPVQEHIENGSGSDSVKVETGSDSSNQETRNDLTKVETGNDSTKVETGSDSSNQETESNTKNGGNTPKESKESGKIIAPSNQETKSNTDSDVVSTVVRDNIPEESKESDKIIDPSNQETRNDLTKVETGNDSTKVETGSDSSNQETESNTKNRGNTPEESKESGNIIAPSNQETESSTNSDVVNAPPENVSTSRSNNDELNVHFEKTPVNPTKETRETQTELFEIEHDPRYGELRDKYENAVKTLKQKTGEFETVTKEKNSLNREKMQIEEELQKVIQTGQGHQMIEKENFLREKSYYFPENATDTEIEDIVQGVVFTYDKNIRKFQIFFNHVEIESISISPKLSYTLGFENEHFINDKHVARYGVDMRGGIDQLYVYSNISQDMIVGDSLSSLMRIVSVSGKPGDLIERIYDAPIFNKVNVHDINEIEIEIRTPDGRLVPFEFGVVVVTLVFKKVLYF